MMNRNPSSYDQSSISTRIPGTSRGGVVIEHSNKPAVVEDNTQSNATETLGRWRAIGASAARMDDGNAQAAAMATRTENRDRALDQINNALKQVDDDARSVADRRAGLKHDQDVLMDRQQKIAQDEQDLNMRKEKDERALNEDVQKKTNDMHERWMKADNDLNDKKSKLDADSRELQDRRARIERDEMAVNTRRERLNAWKQRIQNAPSNSQVQVPERF